MAPDRPAAVVAANRVVAVTPAGRAEGVRPGLRRREAQGRCPELEVVATDAGRDARAWEPVVAAVERLTTAVEVLGPGTLGFGTRGPSRYFGGDAALAARVEEVAVTAMGLPPGDGSCRVGVADGRFAAGRAARVARPGGLVIPPGESRAWLAPAPVSALGPVYEDLSGLLVRLGVPTLGDLAALPAPDVLGRFGHEGMAAHRLARGLDDRPVHGREPPPDLSCAVEMDPPEERVEAAAFAAKTLADQLHARLDAAGLATTAVAIEVETEHGESLVRNWRHEGALSATALAERTRWQLDGWLSGTAGAAPTGGLTLLRLTPLEVRPDGGRQLDFWGGLADTDARAARAMARVQGLLGPEAVVTAVLVGGRGCAEQIELVPWGDALPDQEPGRPWPGRLADPSPAAVHPAPLTADLIDDAGRPVEVSGRGMISGAPAALAVQGGPLEEIHQWAGPWPIEERWWEAGGRRRARMQVVVGTGRAHLVYRESGRWWVEATYD
jgi:protein ImuB